MQWDDRGRNRAEKKTECKEFEGLIALYVSGDLSPSESRLVAEHLEACPTCRKEGHLYRERLRDLALLGSREMPDPLFPDFTDQVLLRARIEGAALGEEELLPARKQDKQRWLPAVLAAAAAILFAAAGLYFLVGLGRGDKRPASTPAVAQKTSVIEEEELGAPPGTGLLPRQGVLPAGAPEEETIEF